MNLVSPSLLLAGDSPASPQDDKKILSLSSLLLSHFRNYTSSRIEVTGAPVVLTGSNGAGKTNILEAISLLTPGRGLRRARLSDMRSQGREENWVIASTVCGMQGEVKIGTGGDPESDEQDKRLVRIDGKPARSQAELARHLAVIWLTPQMERLFQETPSASRKFLDRLVYSFDAEHAGRINEYEFAMRERNKILQQSGYDAIWLDALEQTMAETAASIASARLQTASGINHAIACSDLSFPKAHIAIQGFMEDRLRSDMPAVEAEESLKIALRNSRNQDAGAGRALVGTHRSEMHVTHLGKQMPAQQCSTGEQKAVLLSIVLAQARAGASWKGVVPIILLDEVIAHLDSTRRLELFQEICQIGAQTWMTGTDAKLFADLQEKAQYFQVENGAILRQ